MEAITAIDLNRSSLSKLNVKEETDECRAVIINTIMENILDMIEHQNDDMDQLVPTAITFESDQATRKRSVADDTDDESEQDAKKIKVEHGNEIQSKLFFVGYDKDRVALPDEKVIFVPEILTMKFFEEVDRIAKSRIYTHLHLDFRIYNRESRMKLFEHMAEIKAEEMVTVDTRMNQYDFPIIVKNKIRVIIREEHTTMYSAAYFTVIQSIYNGWIITTHLKTRLQCSEYVYSYLIRDLKQDDTLGPLCKPLRGGGIKINYDGFKLILDNNFLIVEDLPWI